MEYLIVYVLLGVGVGVLASVLAVVTRNRHEMEGDHVTILFFMCVVAWPVVTTMALFMWLVSGLNNLFNDLMER